jgi:hypothetical protein
MHITEAFFLWWLLYFRVCLSLYLFTCFNWSITEQILRKYEHYAITDHPKLHPFNFLQLRIISWMMHKFVRWERYYCYMYFWNHINIAATSTTITKVSDSNVDVIVKATQQTGWSRGVNNNLDLYWGKAQFKFQPEQQISRMWFFVVFLGPSRQMTG